MKKNVFLLCSLTVVLIFLSCAGLQPLPRPPVERIDIEDFNVEAEKARHLFIPKIIEACQSTHKTKHKNLSSENKFVDRIKMPIANGDYNYDGTESKGNLMTFRYKQDSLVPFCIYMQFMASPRSRIFAYYSPALKPFRNREYFLDKKYILQITDACHSGGIGNAFDIARRSNRGIKVNPINSSIQRLSTIDAGICVISSSKDMQMSQEDHRWGGGHGVFTYYFLKGLNGDADFDQNKIVSLGEIIPYISANVRRATKNGQSPIVSGKFDPGLSIGR